MQRHALLRERAFAVSNNGYAPTGRCLLQPTIDRPSKRFAQRRLCRQKQLSATPKSVEGLAVLRFPAPAPAEFAEDLSYFSEQHRVRGYEVVQDQRSTIITIANYLQESAGNHAVGMWGRTDAGFANVPSMKDLVFVMTRLQIRMHAYPKWGDMVTIETYFSDEGRLAARRDWCLIDASTGKELGAATSTWVTINMATRRLAKLPDDVRNKFLRFAPKPRRHAVPVEDTKKKLPEWKDDHPQMVSGPKQVARRSDMDMNGHVNNVTYLAWAMETVPQDIYDAYKLHEVELDFKAECKAGDVVEALSVPLEQPASHDPRALQFLHVMRRCDDASGPQELVRMRTTWKEKGQH